jgi:hypothetical protein
MIKFPKNSYVFADLNVVADTSLEEAVDRLSQIFGGIGFVADYGFEEFPAFSAFLGKVKISLLGIPLTNVHKPEIEADSYQLIVRQEDFHEDMLDFDAERLISDLITGSGLLRII